MPSLHGKVFLQVGQDGDEDGQTQTGNSIAAVSTAPKHGQFTSPSVTTEGIADRHGPEPSNGPQVTQADERFDGNNHSLSMTTKDVHQRCSVQLKSGVVDDLF